jgi:hypothetical protein
MGTRYGEQGESDSGDCLTECQWKPRAEPVRETPGVT